MFKIFIAHLCLIVYFIPSYAQKTTLNGYIKEAGSGELLLGVSVSVPAYNTGTTSNVYGFYSLTLPATDSLEIIFHSAGYKTHSVKVPFLLPLQQDFFLELESSTMEEVVILGDQRERVSETTQMSTIDIPISQIKSIPALFGEKDVLKVIQLMPGVQKGSEGNSGIYVRGGGPDQNLIILDDATVYNAFHLFGFFSLFNGDALKSVELIKGGFPAKYGGRLSSVIDMNMKDGNKEKFHGNVGVGLISSRFTLEGPIKKNKSSFIVSGRRSYIDLLMRPFMKESKYGYYFYDLNAKINYDFGIRNKVFLSGYFGKDKFYLKEKYTGGEFDNYGMKWGNATGTLRWNHLFNQKMFSNASLILSTYNFNISNTSNFQNEPYSLSYKSGISDFTFKYDMDYIASPQHSFTTGFQGTFHQFTPSAFLVKSVFPGEQQNNIKSIDVFESAFYVQDVFKPTENILSNIGLRISHFQVQGKNYLNIEPRFSMAYRIRKDLTLKTSYSLMNQYLHLISNTGIGLPTDLWVPATRSVAPQRSGQVAAGLAKDFLKNNFSITLEGYYKKSRNIVGYKEGASFLSVGEVEANDPDPYSWQNKIISGKSWSYGSEILLQKKTGRISGWIGYTLSWTYLQFDSLNLGKKFYARYDRRHDVSLVVIFKLSEKITLSSTWVFGTGNAITLPKSYYVSPAHEPEWGNDRNYNYDFNTNRTEFSEKNAFRMAPYHRLDFGIQFHKKIKCGERTWELSIYNVYNRKNPFFYTIEVENNRGGTRYVLKQISLFPIIPSISYHLKF